MVTKSALFQLIIASVLLATLAKADICPPANGKIPSDWTAIGNSTPQPFGGAVYGLFGPTRITCKYGPDEVIPINSYALVSHFSVRKPDTNVNQPWQWINNHITCPSRNINDCQFTRY